MEELEDVVESKIEFQYRTIRNTVFGECLTFNKLSKFLATRSSKKKGCSERCSLILFDVLTGKFSTIGVWKKSEVNLFKWDEESFFVFYESTREGLCFYKMKMIPPYRAKKKLRFSIRKPRTNLSEVYFTPLDIVSDVRNLKRMSVNTFCGISSCFIVVFSVINDETVKVLKIFRHDDEVKIRHHFVSKIHENSVYLIGDPSLEKCVSLVNVRKNTSKSFPSLKIQDKRIGDVKLLTKHSGNRRFEFLVYSSFPNIVIEYLYDSELFNNIHNNNNSNRRNWNITKTISNLAENDWIQGNRRFVARRRSKSSPRPKKSEVDKILILEQNYVFYYSGSKKYFQVDQLQYSEEEEEEEEEEEKENYIPSFLRIKKNKRKKEKKEEEEEENENENENENIKCNNMKIKVSRVQVMKERIRCQNLKSIEILDKSLNDVKFLFLQSKSFKIVTVSGLNVLETTKYVQSLMDEKERILYIQQLSKKKENELDERRRRRRRKMMMSMSMNKKKMCFSGPLEGIFVSIRLLRNNTVIENILKSFLFHV